MKVYICADHPDKTYTSWRKFSGHWSTQHKGEERLQKEDVVQEVEKEDVLEEKREKKAEKSKVAAEAESGIVEPPAGDSDEFTLSDEPTPRLARILNVHGVQEAIVSQILGVFQLHPGYQNNPVNLHYLLTAKLPRKLHQSIPMMVSAFTTTEYSDPAAPPLMMGPGMQGPGMMPPFMQGGGYGFPPQYPPQFQPPQGYGYPPQGPPRRREIEEDEESPRRRKGKEEPVNSMADTLSLMGAFMTTMREMSGGGGDGEGISDKLSRAFDTMTTSMEAAINEAKQGNADLKESLAAQLQEVKESGRQQIEQLKETLHRSEVEGKDVEITRLRDELDTEQSEGLGDLLKEAGAGMATQVDGIRESISQAGEKIGSIVENLTSGVNSPPSEKKSNDSTPASQITVAEAGDLLELESEIDELASAIEGKPS